MQVDGNRRHTCKYRNNIFHILSQLEVCHPEFSELMFDMREKDKQQWEKILNMAVANREIETAMDIKQLASVFVIHIQVI